MIKKIETSSFYPKSRAQWRKWLQQNHTKKQSVWLICYKKETNIPTIPWSIAVDEALCFGWIDSIRKTIDEQKHMQFFSKRKTVSTWSKINKQKIIILIEQGLMTKAGFESIETAKQNGSWSILDTVEELEIPADLNKAFKVRKGSKAFFESLSKSVKKMMLQWIVLAKRPETRKKRIDEIATMASKKQKPKQFG